MPQKMNGLLQTYISEIKKIYGTHLSKIILYGSYARGDFRPDSDVDIMILLDLSDLDLKKFGAMLGDFVEVGCNSVLNPGTVIGSHSNVYPLSMVRGVVPANSIYKNKNEIVEKQ